MSIKDLPALEEFEPIKEKPSALVKDVVIPSLPKYGSREWQDFIVSQFQEDELFKGAPRVDGLRRLTEEFMGEILVSEATVVDTPNHDNEGRYVVVHKVVIHCRHDDTVRSFSELADVSVKPGINTDLVFARHPSATASSKAESRALRKALKLRNILTAEEAVDAELELKDDDEGFSIEESDSITIEQKAIIEVKCDKLGIDLERMLARSKQQYRNLDDMSFVDAKGAIKYLNDLQQNKKNIPENIKLR